MKKSLVLLAIVLAATAAFFVVKHRRAQPTVATAPAYRQINENDELALVHLACKGQVKVTKGKDSDGPSIIPSCSVCPQGSDFAGEAGSSDDSWTADSGVTEGSFTAPHLHEAVLHIQGCESHATGLGGAFLFRFNSGAWQLVRYLHGAPFSDCDPLPFTGERDALVCETTDMHQGIASDTVQLLMVAPTEADQQADFDKNTFVSVTYDAGNCSADSPGPNELIQDASIDKTAFLPGQNGRKDIAIDASVGRIRKGQVKGDDDCPTATKKPYHLVFRNMGDHFEATDGYEPFAALKREDCCELAIGKTVQPASY